MGNKVGSRRKQSAAEEDGDTLPKKGNSDSNGGTMKRSKSSGNNNSTQSATINTGTSSREKKMKSCPDLSTGATPYRDGSSKSDAAGDGVNSPSSGGSRQMEIKIYRSYTNVAEATRKPDERPDIRVYRRNTFGRRGAHSDAAERSQTLPRGFGRHRNPTTDNSLPSSAAAGSNATAGDVATLPRAPPTQRMSSAELKRQSAPGLYGVAFGESRTCRRSNSTTSMASIGYRVTSVDFPDTSTIKRRLSQFETMFGRCLMQLYSNLPESDQLSTLSVAVRPDRANQHVSLLQYLTSPDIPLDLRMPDTFDDGANSLPKYLLTIQPALFSGLMHVRSDRPGDRAAALSVAGELLACLVAESAAELGRIFEYQISLLSDGLAIELLASQAAHCVIDYLKRTERHLDRNTIVLGAVRGQHVIASGVSPKLSVIIGQRELKWELHEILKKPGLRRELFLFDGNIEVDDDNAPWIFRTSYRHDPMLYGYRGLIVEWDYGGVTTVPENSGLAPSTAVTSAVYRLNGEDEAAFTDEMDWRPDDFHRTYCPYRRLVGADVIRKFSTAASQRSTGNDGSVVTRATSTLAEYVRRLQGDQYARDQIQPICRPITTHCGRSLSANVTERRQSNDDVFAAPDPVVKVSKIPAAATPPSAPAAAAAAAQYPVAVCIANQSTTSPEIVDQHPVVVVVTPKIKPQQQPDNKLFKSNVTDAQTVEQQTTGNGRQSTSSEDTDQFVDVTDTVTDWCPTERKQQASGTNEEILRNSTANEFPETNSLHQNAVSCMDTNGLHYSPKSNSDEPAVVTQYNVVTVETKQVRNGWPGIDGVGHDNGIDGTPFSSDVLMTKTFVIEETTRKTIRSDI